MGFGEAYQGMTDREILIEVATKQDTLERKVDLIKCPSPRCQDHARRLTTLETTEENRKDSGASTIAWLGLFVAVGSVLVAVAALMGG